MESITNQTNIEANVAVINDYESWEERADDDDESSIDDDTLSTMSSVGEVVVPIVAGAKVSDVSFPLPGMETETETENATDWTEVKGVFKKKDVKERFVVGSSNEERSKAFELLEDKKKGGANLLKTRMCRSTETGEECPHGDRCRFAHTLSELRISECFFGDRCRFVRCHRSHEGVYFNNTGKFCNHLHPGETHECFFKRTGKDMPVVVPPKNVETKVVDIPKNDGKNDDKNSVWVPKPKLVYKQPSREEIEELQMKRLAELEEQRQESEANKLADELDGIIREGIKGIEMREEKVKVREEKVKVREEKVKEPVREEKVKEPEPVREMEKELVLRVSASGYLAALEMAMKSGRTNLRVEIV